MFDEKKTASFVLHIYMGVKESIFTTLQQKKLKNLSLMSCGKFQFCFMTGWIH